MNGRSEQQRATGLKNRSFQHDADVPLATVDESIVSSNNNTASSQQVNSECEGYTDTMACIGKPDRSGRKLPRSVRFPHQNGDRAVSDKCLLSNSNPDNDNSHIRSDSYGVVGTVCIGKHFHLWLPYWV